MLRGVLFLAALDAVAAAFSQGLLQSNGDGASPPPVCHEGR